MNVVRTTGKTPVPADTQPEKAVAPPPGPMLRCPNCKLVFARANPSYPRCPRCTKNTITCRNCHWFDRNFFECTNPVLLGAAANLGENQGRIPIQDPDVFIQCAQHSSALLITPRAQAANPVVAQATRVLAMAAAGAVVLLLALSLWSRVPKANAPPKMVMNVRYPTTEIESGTDFVIEFVIQNLEAHESPPVWLRLQQGMFDRVDLVALQPPALDMVVRGGAMSSQGRYYKFNPVPGNAETVVKMQCKAREIGHYRYLVQLDVPGAKQEQRYLDFDAN